MSLDFNKKYSRENWINFLQNKFLPSDFSLRKEQIDIDFKSKYIKPKAYWIGDCESLGDLAIIEIAHSSENDPRISVSRDAFRLMVQQQIDKALFFFVSKNSNNYRFSLITLDLKLEGKDVKYKFSNPKRFSFFLGEEAKIHTPEEFLFKKGRIKDIEDLQDRFSIEVVNKEFYKRIQRLFYKLAGGKVKQGSKKFDFTPMLKLPSTNDHKTMQEFSVRLVGRLVFCWFLKKKKSNAGISLIPENILSSDAIEKHYYHNTIEPLFFELLNTPIEERRDDFRNSEFDLIPFLNGGLFDPNQHEDYYRYSPMEKEYKPSYNLVIPDEWLTEFITLLEIYNFTIDENTSIDIDLSVDPEMLGRIFENLLAEINPETGNTARKATGSYYTPRPIVEYMVDESLIQYLLTKTEIEEQSIRELLDYNIEDSFLTKDEDITVIDALDEIKVLDPACGSGAFPMGILQKMLLILQKVDPESIEWVMRQLDKIPNKLVREAMEEKLMNENWKYKHKMGIIQNAIYGVDIQPIATEISKLRLFLTLIVDENIIDKKANRNIHPLPNLSFKFVTANTLIGLGKTPDLDDWTIKHAYDECVTDMEEVREQYFYEFDNSKKAQLENKIKDIQKKLHSIVIRHQIHSNFFNKLISWNPFEDKASDWFDPSWMFGIESGFDIVIGNPPYIGEKGNKEIFTPLKNSSLGKRFYQGKMDIFYFFFHLGLDLLKNNGINAYITTNYYITATGAKNLRNDFKDRASLLKILNFGEFKIFQSASGQHNMITILRKGYDPQKEVWSAKVDRKGFLKNNINIVRNVLNGNDEKTEYYNQTNKTVFYENDNYIGFWSKEYSGIFEKMVSVSEILNEVCDVNQGIVTGGDKINKKVIEIENMDEHKIGKGMFVLEDSEINEFRIEKEISKPFFKNSEIKRFQTKQETKQNLLFISKDFNVESDLKSKHPNTLNHLLKFKKTMVIRRNKLKENSNQWFTLNRGTSHPHIFTCPKIVVPQRSRTNTFGYNEISWYAASDVFFITQPKENYHLKYILGVLNSKLIYKWLYYRGKRKGENLELTATPLKEIPIAKAKNEEQNVIVEIVDQIIQKKKQNEETQHLESQIDLMVYKLYELNYDEIKIVDPELDKVLAQFGLSKEDYERMSVEELANLERKCMHYESDFLNDMMEDPAFAEAIFKIWWESRESDEERYEDPTEEELIDLIYSFSSTDK